MKKFFLFFTVFLFGTLGFLSSAQTCLIIRDSVIAGAGTTTFSDYIYGTGNRLEQVTHTDSGSAVVTTSDLVLFVGASDISEIRTFNTVGGSTIIRTIKYTYTNGKITRVEVTGDNGGAWTMAHDITYSGNNISSMILDSSSLTGSPEGLVGSFVDFVWNGGNISSLNILFGSDTLEIVVVADNKNNLYKNILNTEGATFLFQAAMQNNMLSAALANDEPGIGQSAGAKILSRSYTYNSNNDVEILTDSATALNSDFKVTQYIYDCNVAARAPQAITLNLYPNPAQNIIRIENGAFAGTVKIFDMAGKQVFFQQVEKEAVALDVSELANGMYSLEMVNKGKVFRGKFVVNE